MKAHDEIVRGLRDAAHKIGVSSLPEFKYETPRDPSHGDGATNLALVIAKGLGKPPRAVAEDLVRALTLPQGIVKKIEIAGPGFINFFLAEDQLAAVLATVHALGERFGRGDTGRGAKVNVEFVSANPTGPLHVGHGRGAALGDAIAALLDWTGYGVTREFYVNDAGTQIDKLARSLWARVQQAVGRAAEVPDGGYHGEYLVELAERILAREGRAFADLPEPEGLRRCRTIGVQSQRAEQEEDLREFGVRFDVIFFESQLYQERLIEQTLADLAQRGHTYERDGALWLRSTAFGDDKDRVLRKSDGSYTYLLPDIAYHRHKRARGFAKAIDIWGADHHGYVARVQAAMLALGYPDDFFHAEIVQLVRVMRGGEEVRFSKRTGEFVTLRDLLQETGVDAARFFFLMRRADSQFVFDVDLAKSQTEENPVFYVQMAHARMSGIFRVAARDPASLPPAPVDGSVLTQPEELDLLKELAAFPGVVARAAETLEPHRITGYLEGLARIAHAWYHKYRVLGEPEERERLALAAAVRRVLANGLGLLGITAPERM
ncbi:MAG: arginine--tRNA ligase [Gemmatimonadetes bacterium]|nr:MAG: arginine--tRNA ligase [Gemmatimonadetes bacterium 13_1_20CM_4_69_16]PYO14679.1 MAG: arginine--tRNA ligase [Gemmatimonadota bacterium]